MTKETKTYRLRKSETGNTTNFQVAIPAHIAARLPEDVAFEIEATDEFIKLTPVQVTPKTIKLKPVVE